jgi:ParB family chromosome partitioning protein
MNKRPPLGRGLTALFEDQPQELQALDAVRGLRNLPIRLIEPNPNQPRRDFSEAELAELTESIARRGILQPLLVRLHPQDPSRYQLVAGERRWRAAQRAGLTEVPVTVQQLADDDMLEVGLLENIQRQDLNAIEEALAYQQLLAQYGYAQEDLAKVVAKSRSHIANLLRLLNLPVEVQLMVRHGQLSMGHARALIPAADALVLAKLVLEQGLSVRETEKLVQNQAIEAAEPTGAEVHAATSAKNLGSPDRPKLNDADVEALQETLKGLLNAAEVGLKIKGKAATLTIRYSDLAELDQLLQRLS